MCGIAGLVALRPLDLSAVAEMTRVQAHRGPDGRGHAFFGADGSIPFLSPSAEENAARRPYSVAFGHVRLSIIDRSDGGHQPMSYGDGRYWITYNGEIYNYRELRSELQALGLRFDSESDTEVILAAYAQWGTECFSRFNGMWALVIWDAVERILVLSRDRFGVKPLHIACEANRLVFASEIKAVLSAQSGRPRANRSAVHDYLLYGTSNAGNETFFEGVSAFPPASYAIVRPDESLAVFPVRFWRLDPELELDMTYEDACGRFRELLLSSVQFRMRSDVSVGACLSGGLDSSSIVCLMRELEPAAFIHTFTARFPEAQYDEGSWAKLAANCARAQWHVSVPTEAGYLAEVDQLLWHQEEPYTTTSLYAQWLVMKQARENGIPVLLDGQGADEILGGYKKFYVFHILSLLKRGQVLGAGKELAMLLRNGDRGYLRWREAVRYMPRFMQPSCGSAEAFLTPTLRTVGDASSVQLGVGRSLRERQVSDLTSYSVPSLLRYEDRNSMAWSIESRVPFLDYRLAEFALGLSVSHKLREGRTKALLRTSLRNSVPDKILDRRDKMGFVTPQSVWMKNGVGAMMERVIADDASPLNDWIDASALLSQWRAASSSRKDTMQSLVFRAGTLAQWATRFGIVRE